MAASTNQIQHLLTRVFEKEKIKAEQDAIEMLAAAGHGSFRDALSLAESLIGFCDNCIKSCDVVKMLGAVDKNVLINLFNFIVNCKTQEISDTVNQIFSVGRNTIAVIKDFLEIIKREYIKSKDKKFMQMYKVFSELETTIKTAQDAASLFEGACLVCAAI